MAKGPNSQKSKWSKVQMARSPEVQMFRGSPEVQMAREVWMSRIRTPLTTPWLLLLLLLSYEGPPTKGPPLLSHIVQQSQVHEHNNALQTPNFPLPVSKGHIKTLEADKRPLYGFFLRLSFSSPVILLLSTLYYYIQNPHNIDLNKIRHQNTATTALKKKIRRNISAFNHKWSHSIIFWEYSWIPYYIKMNGTYRLSENLGT